MRTLSLSPAGYPVTLLLPEIRAEGVVYLPAHGGAEALSSLPDRTGAAIAMIAGFDWNKDLSPWAAEAVFGNEAFLGQADAFLTRIEKEIIPSAEQAAQIEPEWRGMAGYSLAGLFALYAAYRSSLFTRVASASGSVWFDGWMEYAQNTPFAADVTRAYFSVGAKEKRTRNLRMQPVEENTRALHTLFERRGVRSGFVLHPGNHFTDADGRLAQAVEFLAKKE